MIPSDSGQDTGRTHWSNKLLDTIAYGLREEGTHTPPLKLITSTEGPRGQFYPVMVVVKRGLGQCQGQCLDDLVQSYLIEKLIYSKVAGTVRYMDRSAIRCVGSGTKGR